MTLEQRLQAIEDVQAIARLKAAYCNAADCGWERPANDCDGLASLFVEDGVWDAGAFGKAEGSEAIRRKFREDRYPLGFHNVSNPVITVYGDRATGEWHLLAPCILSPESRESMWIAGVYRDDFVRTPDGWKFKHLRVSIAFTGNSAQGWQAGGN